MLFESTILPYFREGAEFKDVLFVGCDWYTAGYRKMFRHKHFVTIDIDPAKYRYGAKQHIVAPFERVADFLEPLSMDVIICNGVFGWGLNERSAVELAFQSCHSILREGGIFVLGWNDTKETRPFELTTVESLNQFEPYTFPPLGVSTHKLNTDRGSTYSFYIKPALTARDNA